MTGYFYTKGYILDFLVADASSTIRESLCYVLLSFGIKGYPVSSFQTAKSALQENPDIIGAIIDIDSKEIEGIDLIEYIKKSENTKTANIIVHTVQSSKDLVVKMVDLGVVGYLLKPYNEELIFPKLKKILEKSENHNRMRKHIRVRPDPEELLRISFRVPGCPNLISGKVVDISVGGIAAELLNPPEENILKPGTHIPDIKFTVNSKQFSPSGKVILNKSNLLALRFDSLNLGEKTNLARYIFKRISS